MVSRSPVCFVYVCVWGGGGRVGREIIIYLLAYLAETEQDMWSLGLYVTFTSLLCLECVGRGGVVRVRVYCMFLLRLYAIYMRCI